MNKDADLLAEAYQKVLEEAMHCKAAKSGCDCDRCDDCKDNQTVDEAKNAKPDYIDIDKDGDKEESMKKAVADKKKKSMHKENAEMADAYETILEFKHINKKFARRYNKVTAAMLKAQPGSEEYGKLKAEREDLVSVLKDHGQTPKDLEAFLVKKEKDNPLPEVQDQNPQTHNQYQDNSYSDTADLTNSNSDISVAAAMENPSIEASAMAPDAPVQSTVAQYVTKNS
jgi:glutaredoxin